MIIIDGSQGEGGGQILRSALSLSLITGKEFRITNIRANRSKPGLRPQHLCAVRAAISISKGNASGEKLGATQLEFSPNAIKSGRYRFNIGTAGATSLVLQTIFVPLSKATAASSVTITGGTHVPWSPSYHYLEMQWLLWMQRIGFEAKLSLDFAGFYPQGGGKIHGQIKSTNEIKPITVLDRGPIIQILGISAVANLDRRIAERQRSQVLRRLGEKYRLNDIRIKQLPSKFKGTLMLLLAEFENSQACYFALGKPGKPAEQVADEAVNAMEAFIATEGVIDEFMADQLLLPLAFASGPSMIKTPKVTNHLVTNSKVIKAFINTEIDIDGEIDQPGSVSIRPQ